MLRNLGRKKAFYGKRAFNKILSFMQNVCIIISFHFYVFQVKNPILYENKSGTL